MLIIIGIIAVVLLMLTHPNQSVAPKQKSDLIKGASSAVTAIGKWMLGFAIISLTTYAFVFIASHGEIFKIAVSLVVIAVVILVALNFKTIQRERFFESQINAAKWRRIEMGIPHYSSKSYQYYLGSSNWITLAKHATDAMDGNCEFCGKGASSVHHVYYPKNRSNLGLENIASLCVVCKKCHDVLHGMDAQSVYKCPLCQKAKGTKKLAIKINHHGKPRQLVCGRCKSIATGFRDNAYKWSFTKYRKWINEWQELVFADLMGQRNK